MHLDSGVLQDLERLGHGPQAQPHATAEDDHRASAVEQILDVARLDARLVPGAVLGSVPLASAARIELEVLAAVRASTSMRPHEMCVIRGDLSIALPSLLSRYHALPPEIGVAAYRTVQEALTNVVKHAAAGVSRWRSRGTAAGSS